MKFLCDKCSSYKGKLKLFSNEHQDKHLFDSFSFMHFNSGMFYYDILRIFFDQTRSIQLSIIITFFWEYWEQTDFIIDFWKKNGYPQYEGDTLINIVGDVICNISGIYTANKINDIEKKILLYFIFEIIPYYISRENIIKILFFS